MAGLLRRIFGKDRNVSSALAVVGFDDDPLTETFTLRLSARFLAELDRIIDFASEQGIRITRADILRQGGYGAVAQIHADEPAIKERPLRQT
jgi:hypothetical protein